MRLRPRITVDVLSGFLGSGKTTLLRRHLSDMADVGGVAVVINEFGATAIDHRLMRHSSDSPRVVSAGCACCAVADELRETLLQLLRDDARGSIPAIKRIVLETSGLADPASILGTLRGDGALAEYIEIGRCVVAFDALDGIACSQRYPEVLHQLSAADSVVITKADLVQGSVLADVAAFVAAINPLARIDIAASPDFAVQRLFVGQQTREQPSLTPARHAQGLSSFCISREGEMDWASFSVWLTCLLNRHGARILRFKAILDDPGTDRPLVLHGVRHIVYPPQHIDDPQRKRGRSDLVFIVDGVDRREIEESLERFLQVAQVARGVTHPSRVPVVDATEVE